MKRAVLLILSLAVLVGCGSKKDNPAPIIPPTTKPAAAVLVSPAQNQVCTTGTVVSSTESDITFTWKSSANTDNYTLTIKNLLNSDSVTQTTSATQLTLSLIRGTPYAWHVTSLSSKTNDVTNSDTWKFYNSGPGIVSYAPFPADIISPAFAQNVAATSGTISLKWSGGSPEANVALSYDIYLGTTNTPVVFKSAVIDTVINDVPVTSQTTYYWKVVTRDSNGNTSTTGLYEFVIM